MMLTLTMHMCTMINCRRKNLQLEANTGIRQRYDKKSIYHLYLLLIKRNGSV